MTAGAALTAVLAATFHVGDADGEADTAPKEKRRRRKGKGRVDFWSFDGRRAAREDATDVVGVTQGVVVRMEQSNLTSRLAIDSNELNALRTQRNALLVFKCQMRGGDTSSALLEKLDWKMSEYEKKFVRLRWACQ